MVMGISNIESEQYPTELPSLPPPDLASTTPTTPTTGQKIAGVLDAVGKGRSKGKEDSNVRLRCQGTGHYSWACPTVRDSTDTRVCDGCKGKGHIKRDCPTASPQLKGQNPKGGGKNGWNKGNGSWGKNNGKGKEPGYGTGSGKGKGLSSFDFMWEPSRGDWGQQAVGGAWGNYWYGGLQSLCGIC